MCNIAIFWVYFFSITATNKAVLHLKQLSLCVLYSKNETVEKIIVIYIKNKKVDVIYN